MTNSKKVFTVSAEILASHAEALVRYLKQRGDYEHLLQQYGTQVSALSIYQPQQRVPIEAVASNLDLIASWINEPNLGLKLAPYSSRRLNRLAFFFTENPFSLMDYLRILTRYIAISSEVMRLECVLSTDSIRLRIHPNCPENVSIHQTEGFVASLCDALLQSHRIKPLAIEFSHSNPTHETTLYERMLGLTPAFNRPITQLTFHSETKDALTPGPSLTQVPSPASFIQIQAMEAVKRKEIGEECWVERCRFLLEILMYYGTPQKGRLADLLAVTPRTLQRRLEDEGITFRNLLTELRKELALKHMSDPHLNFNEIAFLLGYQDVGQFTKAFKEWFGVPPGRYRKHR